MLALIRKIGGRNLESWVVFRILNDLDKWMIWTVPRVGLHMVSHIVHEETKGQFAMWYPSSCEEPKGSRRGHVSLRFSHRGRFSQTLFSAKVFGEASPVTRQDPAGDLRRSKGDVAFINARKYLPNGHNISAKMYSEDMAHHF